MAGAPRAAYTSQDFVIVSMTAVRELGGSWITAGCFQRIAWRAERDGYWTATMQQIAEELCCSVRTAKRVTQQLRDLGWVTAERETAWQATLTWRVVWEGADPGAKPAPGPSAKVALSPSSKTVETTTPAAAASRGVKGVTSQDQPTALAAEREHMSTAAERQPVAADVPLTGMPEPEPKPPAPSAGELVAAWCKGWSEAHGGQQPHTSVVRRVAGVCKNVARDCADIEEWRDAYRAAYAAGACGRYDVVAHLAAPTPQGRQNHHLALARNPEQLTNGGLLGVMLGQAQQQPRAIGGQS